MSLLQGDSLSVLSSLAPDECGSYTLIKEKLLKRFGCDCNGFRDTFFQSRQRTEENFESFVYRTKRYFDRWLDLAKVNTYDGLIFLLLFETVMATCNEEFVAHIKDQSPSNIPKLIGIATSYSDSRPNKPFAKAAMSKVSFAATSTSSDPSGRRAARSPCRSKEFSPIQKNFKRHQSASLGRPHANSQAAPRYACFSCQGFGHVAKDCPSDVATKSSRGFRSSGSQNTKPGQVDFAPASDNSQHDVLHRVNTKCQTEETSVANGVSTNVLGHAGFRKTLATIKSEFSWPGLSTDTLTFVRSCHICQVKAPIGRDKPAPFQTIPIISEPFSRLVIDLVGPLPVSSNRYEYILTVVDVATRFADAVPLRSITAKNVGENLFSIFTRLGFPKQVQSDQSTQFMSQLFRELSILSGFEHKISTAFHPETNAYVERFHGTLKTMLRKLSHERPSDWDRYLCGFVCIQNPGSFIDRIFPIFSPIR
ncbi:gypsy retrotransposon integrase-like protein 1 [Plakobranchus ocellatus]|uniref:Gypsy retrotransposon integrase-like protein 1 n=1 Tax=Plakobranchus ocellatus TaxID=259542 RepID=A0AAV4B820_9GAST|nr:gypsy retrotransposon integrase-like protein 1 [Plakobranchus ocellatus]